MNELTLIKSAEFGGVQCDFYGKNNEVYMTINQLAVCLGYADRSGIQKIVDRNDYLNKPEFSCWDNLSHESGAKKTRIFTEDGIYEVTMLSKTEKAKEFRAWVRGILKALRSGKAKLVGMTEYQQMIAETRRHNIAVQKARLLNQIAAEYEGTYRQVLQAHATKELTGEFLLPLPRLEAKTYSAAEIGNMLGITGNMVGILTNRHNLKKEQYGAWFQDKAKGHRKEVQSFRYYDSVIPVLRELLTRTEERG